MVASHFERVIGGFDDDSREAGVGVSKPKATKKPGQTQDEEQLGDAFFGGSGAKSHRGEGCEG